MLDIQGKAVIIKIVIMIILICSFESISRMYGGLPRIDGRLTGTRRKRREKDVTAPQSRGRKQTVSGRTKGSGMMLL